MGLLTGDGADALVTVAQLRGDGQDALLAHAAVHRRSEGYGNNSDIRGVARCPSATTTLVDNSTRQPTLSTCQDVT